MTTRLLIATRNRGKQDELQALLSDVAELEVISIDDLSARGIAEPPEVVEDGGRFEANAIKKAVSLARHARMFALADDSGLEVDALDGAPGVRSARYAGEGASDADNNRKLLAALAAIPASRRTARFRCAVVIASPEGRVVQRAEGTCEGHIALALSGSGGFGYDSLFIPVGEARTMAELSPREKHAISHRGRALAQIKACISVLLQRSV